MTSEIWLHDLRNAVNTALTASAVVGSLLRKGDLSRALKFNKEVQEACERCRTLILEQNYEDSDERGSA